MNCHPTVNIVPKSYYFACDLNPTDWILRQRKTVLGFSVTLILLASVLAYYYSALQSTMNSDNSQIASLQSQMRRSSVPYQVVFSQGSSCLYAYPWGVELGNVTKTNPPNAKFEPGVQYLATNLPKNESTITFSLPDGIYYYTLIPLPSFTNDFTQAPNATGLFQVNDGNVTVGVTTSCPKSIP
jgi:hypothetical protein